MRRLSNSKARTAKARSMRRMASVLALGAALSACAAVTPRSPAPENQIAEAAPHGISDSLVRSWGDNINHVELERLTKRWADEIRLVYKDQIASGERVSNDTLVLSGGGPDGAFGAGLLKGWTERGDRPEFDMVTGVSTGSIIGLFAFLGSDYDDELEEIYTTYETTDLISPSLFTGITGGVSFTKASGYRALIERYIDDEVVERLAEQHRRGRILLVGTTNLDAARPMSWNIAHIAATGDPNAKRLIHDIIQASSAIPGVFPPVLIPVIAPDGRRYDELHVDGGATQQLMLFSPEISLRKFDEEIGLNADRRIFVIVNNKLIKPYEPVKPSALDIAGKAVSSLISGSGGGDIYKIFAIAQRDDVELNVVSIPRDFSRVAEEPFDPVYMKALYDLGYEIGLIGEAWLPHPSDYAPAP